MPEIPSLEIVMQYPVMALFFIFAALATGALFLVSSILWFVFRESVIGVAEGRKAAALRKGHKHMAEKGKENLKGDYYE